MIHETQGATPTVAPSETDIAWAAGLFDGEGSTTCPIRRDRGYGRLVMSMTMQDKETIDRFASIVGGKVYGPYAGQRADGLARPPEYKWNATGGEANVHRILLMFAPYMSSIKKRQAAAAITKRLSCPNHGPATKANGRWQR